MRSHDGMLMPVYGPGSASAWLEFPSWMAVLAVSDSGRVELSNCSGALS